MAKKEKGEKAKTSTYRNISENWKTVVAQGAVALVIGVIILAVPDLSEKVVRYLLGGFLVVYAVLSLVGGLRATDDESKPGVCLYLKVGLAGAGGLVILFWPGLTSLTLLYILAVFAIVAGVVIGGTGLLQKWSGFYKMIAGLGGLLSIVFGIILISESSSWSGSIVWMTGVYALLLGLLNIVLGLGARAIGKT
jgi:uncharacterized membrane protein HdeD (DUF308 family)